MFGFSSGNKSVKAREFLEQLFSNRTEISVNEIKFKAIELDISWRTLEKAKVDLKIKSVKVGNIWFWKCEEV